MPQAIHLLLFLLVLLLPGLMSAIFILHFRKRRYENSEYRAATGIPFRAVRRDLGLWGEYLTWQHLKRLRGYKKFLFNCYIPKGDGTLTEIDLILLHASGVYVIESKNYSGWIFGNEEARYWTQSFRRGRRERFFNPIKQNNAHIKQLRRFVPGLKPEAIQSVIVFSKRCALRKITLTTRQHIVIKRNQVLQAIAPLAGRRLLSSEDIDAIFQRLFPHTQLTEQEKQAHRQRIAEMYQKNP